MSLQIYIPAYAEPLSLVEVKNHIRVESSFTDDDVLIASQTTAARDMIETATGANTTRNRVMLATTFDYKLNSFFQSRNQFGGPEIIYQSPNQAWAAGGVHSQMNNMSLQLPRCPLLELPVITYVDMNGNTATVDSATYSYDAPTGRVNLNYNQYWPYSRYQANAVNVRFVAGLATTVTADATTNIFTSYGHNFTTGDRVQIVNTGGALPAGLSALTTYFVIGASGATFQLSATSGGSAIDITTAGTGTQFLGLDMIGFETLRNAIKLLVGFWYDNRSAVDTGRQAVGATVLPFAVDALVNTQHA